MISINHIQQAHKKADNGFNDVIAELYDLEFRKQEILNKERVNEARNKAIELQRVEEENRKKAEQEAERIERERQEASDREAESNKTNQTRESLRKDTVTIQSSEGSIGNTWTEVSPEQASAYMASKTPIPASKWASIIYAESTNNPNVTNPRSGTFGYLQLHPIHGNVSSMTPQQYLDTAVSVYNSQGLSAWEVVTLGMVN